MFPVDEIDSVTVQTETKDIGRSFRFDLEAREFVVKDGKVSETNRLEAIKQWVSLLLVTAAGRYKIYDDTNFGINLDQYIGYKKGNLGFVKSELKREISEKIIENRSIDGIENFDIIPSGDDMKVSFTVILKTEEEVEVSQIV